MTRPGPDLRASAATGPDHILATPVGQLDFPRWHVAVKRHIESKGPLSAEYPEAIYLWEGDTPSFLHLLPNGLSDPEQPHWGSWGGRFEPVRKTNVRSGTGNDTVDGLWDPHRDYALFSNARDAWSFQGTNYHSEYATVFRWRQDFQNDFFARMDWAVADDYKMANHNPVAVLNGDTTRQVLQLTARAGNTLTLSSAGSSDPDGEAITSHWMIYPEPGTLVGAATLSRAAGQLIVPEPGPGSPAHPTLHVILTVRDQGTRLLTAYRRAIVTVKE